MCAAAHRNSQRALSASGEEKQAAFSRRHLGSALSCPPSRKPLDVIDSGRLNAYTVPKLGRPESSAGSLREIGKVVPEVSLRQMPVLQKAGSGDFQPSGGWESNPATRSPRRACFRYTISRAEYTIWCCYSGNTSTRRNAIAASFPERRAAPLHPRYRERRTS
jgi:hypothetical protein